MTTFLIVSDPRCEETQVALLVELHGENIEDIVVSYECNECDGEGDLCTPCHSCSGFREDFVFCEDCNGFGEVVQECEECGGGGCIERPARPHPADVFRLGLDPELLKR